MKKILLFFFLTATIFCNAVDYWSISTTLWSNTDGGADCSCSPGNLTTGDNVRVRHAISTAVMTLSGTPSVIIYSGGNWNLTGGAMDINAGSWTINLGGHLKISGGNLTAGGFSDFIVNGTLGITGDLTNNGAITGSGGITYTGSLTNNGSITPLTTLPVELVDFSVVQNRNSVDVKWSTASEIKSEYFSVLRSSNTKDFVVLGKIAAAGQSNSKLDYYFSDPSPLKGLSYYQLEEYDQDGASQSSSIIAIDVNGDLNMITQLFPNPSPDNVALYFNSEKGGAYFLNLYGGSGDVLLFSAHIPAMIGQNSFSVSLENFEGDRFVLTLTDPDQKVSSAQIMKK